MKVLEGIKSGLASLLVEDAQSIQNKNIVFSLRLKLHRCVFAPPGKPTEPPLVSADQSINPGRISLLPADSEIKSYVIISPDGYPCFRPVTFCNVHNCSGFLRLEEIQDSEGYTPVEAIPPSTKVTHVFNDCVLEFPPAHKLIVFKKNQEYQADENHNPYLRPSSSSRAIKAPTGPSSSSSNFLRNCMNCHRALHKKDIYIYMGDAWYCSDDCRHWNTGEGKEELNMELARVTFRMEQKLMCERAGNSRHYRTIQPYSLTNNHNYKGKAVLRYYGR